MPKDDSRVESQQQPRGMGPAPSGSSVPVPDPTTLTDAAIARATEVFRREIRALRETLETRINGTDEDRQRIWERLHELPGLYENFTNHLRDELIQRDAQDREVLAQRITDIDTARELTREDAAADRARIRQEMHTTVQGLQELVEQRLDSMDKAARVLAFSVEKFPSDLDRAVGSSREVMLAEIARVGAVTQEKFAAVDALFASNALALTAALAAQEKAVAEQNRSNTLAITKSEVSTKETIAANAAQTQTGLASLDAKMTDIKERVVRIESTGAGAATTRVDAREDRNEHKLNTAQMLQTVAIIIVGLGVVISIIALLLHK